MRSADAVDAIDRAGEVLRWPDDDDSITVGLRAGAWVGVALLCHLSRSAGGVAAEVATLGLLAVLAVGGPWMLKAGRRGALWWHTRRYSAARGER